MRQNGLRASSFVAVADVDPRIADQLLDLLAFAHVAAYAEPVPGRTGVYRDHHVPARPIDRLWVDRDATDTARQVLERSLPHLQAELETAITEGTLAGPVPGLATPVRPGAGSGLGAGRGSHRAPRRGDEMDQAAVDERWQEIVAAWADPDPGADTSDPSDGVRDGADGAVGDSGRSRPDGTGPGSPAASPSGSGAGVVLPAGPSTWDVRADVADEPRPDAGLGARADWGAPSGWGTTGRHVPSGDVDRLGPRDFSPLAEDDHYRPPPPPVHPPVTGVTRLGWAAVVAGPVLLVVTVVFGQFLPTWLPVLGVSLLIGGFLVLVSRLHRTRPEDDDLPHDPDDGAVV